MGPAKKPRLETGIQDLPDELLLMILAHLARLGPAVVREDENDILLRDVPYRRPENVSEPHPGLRAYPFLAQVCRHWRHMLESLYVVDHLWGELVIDFGHELITAVHTPIAWSDRRPSDEEFKSSFNGTRLSAHRILAFVDKRRTAVRRLVLYNSEGYWMAEGEYISLQQKHNFGLTHFGMLLGMLHMSLRELHIHACNDIFCLSAEALSAVACLPNLQRLQVEDVQCRADLDGLSELSKLQKLEELVITADEVSGSVGVEVLPDSWSRLTCLSSLTLRGHPLLARLPDLLSSLPLLSLDLSCCRSVDVAPLAQLTHLTMLSLHSMELYEPGAPPPPPPGVPGTEPTSRRVLPELSPLTRLEALQLSGNQLARVPPFLSALVSLRYLDLSYNRDLKVPTRLRKLAALPHLHLVDFRGVHEETQLSCWSEEKGTTMKHIAQLARHLKNRRRLCPGSVLANYSN